MIRRVSPGIDRPRVLDRDFLEHVQKIGLIVVLAAIWILFRVQAVAPQAHAPLPRASSPVPSASHDPLASSFWDQSTPAMEIAHRVLAIPVKGIQPAELYDSFDEKRGSDRRHDAIDILATSNTPVLAVEDGTIVRLENNSLGGLSIHQFDSGGRYVYYYAHLARYAPGLEEGAIVHQGEMIGRVGQTGNAQTPHLHFAISRLGSDSRWWSGEAINPYPILLHAQPSQEGHRQAD